MGKGRRTRFRRYRSSDADAPVKEVIWQRDEIDLNKLPTVWHNELDSGYYVDAGVALLRDPDSGKVDAGIYRHLVQNNRELGFMSNPAHHGSYVLRRMRELGKLGMAELKKSYRASLKRAALKRALERARKGKLTLLCTCRDEICHRVVLSEILQEKLAQKRA